MRRSDGLPPPVTIGRCPPGRRRLTRIGHYLDVLRFMRRPIATMEALHETFGDIAALTAGRSNYVFVFSPEYAQRVMADTALFFNLGADSSPLRMQPGTALHRLFAGLTQMNG
jgi:hypothetical protein